jgi:hypothetical protein
VFFSLMAFSRIAFAKPFEKLPRKLDFSLRGIHLLKGLYISR